MTQIFYSYCHDEEEHLKQLRKEVTIVVENAQATEWFDRKISGGEDLSIIFREIERSEIILLLLSPRYLASDSCKREMNIALKRRKKEGIFVVPIVVKRCGWKEHKELKNILAIPTDGKPIVEWNVPGKAWDVVRAELKKSIEETNDDKLNQLSPKSEFRRKIGEVFFVQHGNYEIDIDDIFVFPNLVLENADVRKYITSLTDVAEKGTPTVVRGANQSGKTTLLRKIWMDSWESSDGALIIDGEDVRRHKPSAVIRDAFTQQVQGTWSRWMKKQDKILLMDNASTAFHPQFIAYVEGRFERILYTMTEEEYLAQLKVNGDVAKYRSLRIAPLTHGQQEKLIHNWLDMQIVKRKDSEKYQEIDDLEDHINTIVDRNRIVPRYPFFVLSILQTREAFMPQDLQITAYAHCYQALIVAHLCRSGLQSTELDSAMNLLTELAYKISQDRRNGVRTQRRVFVEEYGQTFVFDERILENIEESGGLLRHDRDGMYNLVIISYIISFSERRWRRGMRKTNLIFPH